MIKKVYLDSLTLSPKYLKSVLTILYNLIAMHRSTKADNFQMTSEKLLEISFCEIKTPEFEQLIHEQINNKSSLLDITKEQSFILTFRIYAEDVKKRGLLMSLIKSKVMVINLEEFDLPINLTQEPVNLHVLVNQLKERMNKILLYIQNDSSSINLTYDLKFELVLKKNNL